MRITIYIEYLVEDDCCQGGGEDYPAGDKDPHDNRVVEVDAVFVQQRGEAVPERHRYNQNQCKQHVDVLQCMRILKVKKNIIDALGKRNRSQAQAADHILGLSS